MSVITFEEHTENLNEKDMDILPFVVNALSMCKEPQLSDNVCDLVSQLYWKETETHIPFTGARLRKFVNHIRINGLLPVIATSKGYYVAYEREQIEKQIQSLNERASAIRKCAEGLKSFLL